jgi:nucleotide-binding universal stress UspA family protein
VLLAEKEEDMKTIVLHAVEHEIFTNRLRYARELAIACNAHINVTYPIPVYAPMAPDMSGSAFTADFIGRMLDVEREQARKVKEKVTIELADISASWQWEQCYGDPTHTLINASKLADVVIVGPSDPENIPGPIPLPVAGSVALHGCAPIIVVPVKECHFDAKAPVVIAWNGSAEAARAIKSALPLLKEAQQVIVVEISEENGKSLPDVDVGSYLDRHDISARMSREPHQGSVAKTLHAVARQAGAHLIVAGAYGRPRLIEYIFGGTSRAMLADPQIPILMAH